MANATPNKGSSTVRARRDKKAKRNALTIPSSQCSAAIRFSVADFHFTGSCDGGQQYDGGGNREDGSGLVTRVARFLNGGIDSYDRPSTVIQNCREVGLP